jgi:hypothetical protein
MLLLPALLVFETKLVPSPVLPEGAKFVALTAPEVVAAVSGL